MENKTNKLTQQELTDLVVKLDIQGHLKNDLEVFVKRYINNNPTSFREKAEYSPNNFSTIINFTINDVLQYGIVIYEKAISFNTFYYDNDSTTAIEIKILTNKGTKNYDIMEQIISNLNIKNEQK